MTIEIREGRGVGAHKDHINLDLTHLGPEVTSTRSCPASPRARASSPASTSTKQPIPVHADRALQHGRHPDQLPRRSRAADATAIPMRWCRACTRSARRPACRCTAPTASAPTRCSTWWCSAARSRTAARETIKPGAPHKPLPATPATQSLANLDALRNANGAHADRGDPRQHAAHDAGRRRGVPHRRNAAAEGVREDRARSTRRSPTCASATARWSGTPT